jgi:hypothetical protein
MGIDLSSSTSYMSLAVMNALGCQWDDVIENLAVERAKQLFGADHVNLRCHTAA